MLNLYTKILCFFVNNKKNLKNENGYTLLEYVAGAAIMASIVYFTLNQMRGGFEELLTNLGGWLKTQDPSVVTGD